jgi:integrase
LEAPHHWRFFYLRQRRPADLAGVAMPEKLVLPVGNAFRQIKAGAFVKVSLDTKDPGEAKNRYREADMALRRFWDAARNGPQPLSQKQIQALAGLVYVELVDQMDAEPGEAGIWEKVIQLNNRKAEQGQLQEWYAPAVDELLGKQGIIATASDCARLIEATHRAFQLAAETNLRKAEGDYSPDETRKRFPTVDPDQKRVKQAPRPAGTFDLFALLDHKFATQSLKAKTKDDYARDLAKFVASSGHRDARDVTKDDVRDWRDKLIGEGLSPSKINGKCLPAISTVLTHAVKEFSLAENVASGIRDGRSGPTPGKKGYDMGEAKAILAATFNGSSKALSAPHQRALFWVPWICAYTGLRVTEITQLRGTDVLEDQGNYCLLISPEAGSTKSGRAWMTGIHPHLIELGLLDMLKAVGKGPAFYVPYPDGTDFAQLKGHRAQEAGNRVGEWVTGELKIPAPGGKPNHAWRHLFTSLSRDHPMDTQARNYMLGSGPEDAREGYGEWSARALCREIGKLPRFDVKEIDWRPSNEVVAAQPQREAQKGGGRVRKGTVPC